MPYIKEERRRYLDGACVPAAGLEAENAGELNYLLTMVVSGYVEEHGRSYQTFNDVVGALDNCKDEFRRRVQHPYEDEKIAENGDVY